MFQKGTGERFKYKEAVREKFPKAVCVSVRKVYKFTLLYYVRDSSNGQPLSKEFTTAEKAWADVWINKVK